MKIAPTAWPAIIIIWLYQHLISPLLLKRCRFFPSCSNYAMDSFKQFGLFIGMFYILKRLLKCHPFHDGGFDPVPACKEKNK